MPFEADGGVGDAGAAEAGAGGSDVTGEGALEGADDAGAAAAGAREVDAVDGAGVAAGADGGCLGGLPRFGLVATGVSADTAAGWQFSQWWRSIMSSPLACLPVTTSRTDLPTRRSMGKGPSLMVSKEWLMLDLPLLTYTWVAAAAVAGQ